MNFDLTYLLTVIIPAVVTVIIGIAIERSASTIISSFGKKKDLPQSPIHLMKLIVRWILVIVIIVAVAGIFGVGLENLWISIAAIASMVVVGFFAAWSILGNITATLVVMIWRPFQVGDKLAILPENLSGEVVDMNLLYSKLKTEDGDIIQVPNITFVTKFIKVFAKK